jgi:hypothetical protein
MTKPLEHTNPSLGGTDWEVHFSGRKEKQFEFWQDGLDRIPVA